MSFEFLGYHVLRCHPHANPPIIRIIVFVLKPLGYICSLGLVSVARRVCLAWPGVRLPGVVVQVEAAVSVLLVVAALAVAAVVQHQRMLPLPW